MEIATFGKIKRRNIATHVTNDNKKQVEIFPHLKTRHLCFKLILSMGI